MFFLVVPFCYASLHNEKKHKQRGETLQIIFNIGVKWECYFMNSDIGGKKVLSKCERGLIKHNIC